jgi:NADH-quinone oxidoreductase subunit A
MLLLGTAFAAGGMLASQFVGPRRPTAEKMAPYECGVPPVGDARERQSVKFYLVAFIFLLFDIEVVFFFPWALVFREMIGPGLVIMIAYLAVLVLGLIYAWKKGAFEWD